jgi:adenylate kinase family enzyme
LDYYRQKGLLVEINGEQSVEEVEEDLKRAILAAA